MDAKYLAEIKARCELGRPAQQREVKALLAEVERLTEENEKMKPFYKIADDTFKHWENAAYAMRDEERAKNAVKDQQIDTLKKALSDMLFAYRNKDADCPHQFEIEAVRQANALLHQAQKQEGHDD